MKRLYRRYFVLLDPEGKGYAAGEGGEPKGYAKIEVKDDKALFSLYCQNLKAVDEKKERYRIYLVKSKDVNTPINTELGPMEVDQRGNGEITIEFNAENVKGTKIPVEEFDAIVVLVDKAGDRSELIAPLVGYVHKEKVGWKEAFNKGLIMETIVKPPEFKKKEDIPLIFEKKPNTLDIKPEEETKTLEENNIAKDTEKAPMEDNNKIEKPTSMYSFEGDSEDINSKRTFEAPAEPQVQSQSNHIQFYIESTLKLYPKVNPFENNLPGYEWWQIYHNQQTVYRSYMPFVAYLEILNNPHQYHYPYCYPSDYYRLIYMYQHYLFGICYDEKRSAKYFVYAIPGRGVKEEQPFGGKTGFVYWKACIEVQDNRNSLGYWLLHIDPTTGLMVQPLEPTKI